MSSSGGGYGRVPAYALLGAVVGYVLDGGWAWAAATAVLIGGGGALGAVWALRRTRDR